MSQETLDAAFRKNGFAEAIQNDVRRGITFSQGAGFSFERLVKDLTAEHSIEEVDEYDALFGIYFMYMTMATPLARCQVLADMTDFKLANTQLRIAMAFEDTARELFKHKLLGPTVCWVSLTE